MHFSFLATCCKIEMTGDPKTVEVHFIQDDEPFTIMMSTDAAEASFTVGVVYEFDVTKNHEQPNMTPLEEGG